MNRIYLDHIYQVAGSHSRCRAFLAYLKIRSKVAQNCGGFTLKAAQEILQVSDTTARKNIKALIRFGYITETKNNHYRINSQKSFSGNEKHGKYTHISNELLESFTWKNFSQFRAYIVELRNELNRRYRKAARRGFKNIDRHGVRSTIKSQSNPEFDTLMAGTYVSEMVGISANTAYRYRRIQNLASYTQRQVLNVEKYDLKSFETKGKNRKKELKGKLFHDFFLKKTLFVPISERQSRIIVKGF